MFLCFGSFAHAIKICSKEGVNNQKIVSSLVGTLDPGNLYGKSDNHTQVSRVFNCNGNFPVSGREEKISGPDRTMTNIMNNIPIDVTETNVSHFRNTIMGLIDPDKRKLLVTILKDIVSKDEELKVLHSVLFEEFLNRTPDEFKKEKSVCLDVILPCLFWYSLSIANNTSEEGRRTIKAINSPQYQRDMLSKCDDIELIQYTDYRSKVGFQTRKKDRVTFETEEQVRQALKRSEIMYELIDNEYMHATPDFVNDYSSYLLKVKDRFEKVKILIYGDNPHPFNKCYVCNDIKYSSLYSEQRSRLVRYMQWLSSTVPSDPSSSEDDDHPFILHNATPMHFGVISRFCIITGTGGLGKSMMMQHFMLSALENINVSGFIPIFVSLKDFDSSYKDFLSYLYDRNSKYLEIDKDTLESHLKTGGFLILLDGLDEVAYDNMALFDNLLDDFITSYSNNQFVLSSRPYTDFISYSRFTVLELQPFTKEQSLKMIGLLDFREDEPRVKEGFLKRLDEDLYKSHKEFAQNPLLLTIMLMTFNHYAHVASRMHIFFRDAYETLAWKHDANKGAFERPFKSKLDTDTFANYFAEFCARSYMDEQYEFTYDEFDRIYNSLTVRQSNSGDVSTTQSFIEDLCKNLCILYEENQTYHFIHRSFQEYFCALYFSQDRTDIQLRKLGEIFNDELRKRASDNTFAMLYDMIPKRMEISVFLPYLHSLFKKIDGTYEYYSFLNILYPDQIYYYGELPDTKNLDCNDPKQFLYRFIAESHGFLHKETDMLSFTCKKHPPYDDAHSIEAYVYIEEDDSPDKLLVTLTLSEIEDYEERGIYYDPVGVKASYTIEDIIDITDDAVGYDVDKGYDEFFTDIDHPLYKEYNKAKEYMDCLIQEFKERKRTASLFS